MPSSLFYPGTRLAALCMAWIVVCGVAPAVAAQEPAEIPARAWYPDGYRDLRIAADLMAADFPRQRDEMVMAYFEDPETEVYNLSSCDNYFFEFQDDSEGEERQRRLLAYQVSKLRREFERLGYPRQVYDRPLLEYERSELTGVDPPWSKRLRDLEERFPNGPPSEYFAPDPSDEVIADRQLMGFGMLAALKDEMESRRRSVSPQRPRFEFRGDCPNPTSFEILLAPEDGELWLINAFEFRICERRVADPWAHEACGWRKYAEDGETYLNGHYMFEARWPDGTVRRGPRAFEVNVYDEEGDGRLITFNR